MENTKLVEWILRIGVAGEFLGHGLLAVGGKKDWIGWISGMIHVDAATAGTLLLAIGILDVAAAIIILVKPVRPECITRTAQDAVERFDVNLAFECGVGHVLLRTLFRVFHKRREVRRRSPLFPRSPTVLW